MTKSDDTPRESPFVDDDEALYLLTAMGMAHGQRLRRALAKDSAAEPALATEPEVDPTAYGESCRIEGFHDNDEGNLRITRVGRARWQATFEVEESDEVRQLGIHPAVETWKVIHEHAYEIPNDLPDAGLPDLRELYWEAAGARGSGEHSLGRGHMEIWETEFSVSHCGTLYEVSQVGDPDGNELELLLSGDFPVCTERFDSREQLEEYLNACGVKVPDDLEDLEEGG